MARVGYPSMTVVDPFLPLRLVGRLPTNRWTIVSRILFQRCNPIGDNARAWIRILSVHEVTHFRKGFVVKTLSTGLHQIAGTRRQFV